MISLLNKFVFDSNFELQNNSVIFFNASILELKIKKYLQPVNYLHDNRKNMALSINLLVNVTERDSFIKK